MNIKNFSKLTGLSYHTLRYYEKINLISNVKKNSSGCRDYSSDDLAWVEFLQKLKVTGMPISGMQTFAKLRKKSDSTINERKKLLEEHYERVQTKLLDIQLNLEKIKEKIKIYSKMEKNQKSI